MWRAFLISTVLLAGCAHKEQIRNDATPCEWVAASDEMGGTQCPRAYRLFAPATTMPASSPVAHAAMSKPLYEMAVVEFDDQGMFRDRNQLDAALELVSRHRDNVDVILFIHGWHHSAASEDKNFRSFHTLLNRIATRSATRRLVGLYVGWRGENYPSPLSDVPLLRDTNFWDRKNVSIEVGRGALYELIERLRLKTDRLARSRMITIGHSFGASVLLSASRSEVHRDLIDDAERSATATDPELKPLTVLVNPAIEALHFLPLFEVPEENARRAAAGARGNLYTQPAGPRIVVFTSEADSATKTFFRLGRQVSTLLESHAVLDRTNRLGEPVSLSEHEMDTQALGHYAPFVTHSLAARTSQRQPMMGKCSAEVTDWSSRLQRSPSGEGWRVEFEASDTVLTHLRNSPAFSPVWVVRVDPAIIPDHNDIWDRGLDCLVEELVLTRHAPRK